MARSWISAPSSWPRGSAAGRTDAVRQARRQEGMGSSGNLRTPTTPRHGRRLRSRRQAWRRASSRLCPPASALSRAGCPPVRACARMGGRSRGGKDNADTRTVLLAARQRGREDRRHAPSMAAGGHGWLGRPAYADDPAMRSVMAHPAAGGAARLDPPMPSCQRADARCLSSHPRLRADGRTVARGDRRRSTLPQPRVTRRREEREEKGARPTKAPSSWPRGSAAGRTDAMRQAWRQEGMGGSGDLRTPTIARCDR